MTPRRRPIGPAKLQHATTDRPNHTAENIIADSRLHGSYQRQAKNDAVRYSRPRTDALRLRVVPVSARPALSASARRCLTLSTPGWTSDGRTEAKVFKDRLKLSVAQLGRQALNRSLHCHAFVVAKTGFRERETDQCTPPRPTPRWPRRGSCQRATAASVRRDRFRCARTRINRHE